MPPRNERHLRRAGQWTGIELTILAEFHPKPFDGRVRPGENVFRSVWDGQEKDLVLGEGRELRFVPLADVTAMHVPPYIKDYVRQLADLL
ncbi:hypothetical protein [Kitasatospora sp. MAP5-34]|uniref:hypothetical protein n=1 Tax=Kitasatospora sp. MAP5-34 TaxID=3035102 RepID=UPI002476A7F9|nr:hypothetical protein [Kitasatospora sp. MAP5-34]MDH6580621.1 hypothetical protein [Kitasatospora sp. MAP5-34]